MNCKQAKQISLILILQEIGAVIKKITDREIWYLSPFRDEDKASFKYDIEKNIWFDHGSGKGGNVLDFVMSYYRCDLREALSLLSKESYSFSFHQQMALISDGSHKEQIVSVGVIKHLALKSYLESRGIDVDLAKKYCKEIHYFNDNDNPTSQNDLLLKEKRKPFFAIGFENDLGGYETRNKFFKGCLKTKAITTIKNGSETLNLFEGFLDFLSYLILFPEKENEDFVITNSTSLVEKTIDLLPNYKHVKTFFDNDSSGRSSSEVIKANVKNKFENCSSQYKNHKDLNNYLISIKKIMDRKPLKNLNISAKFP